MWTTILLASALASQTPDPYAVLDGETAAACDNAERAIEANRYEEALALLDTCDTRIRTDPDLDRPGRWAARAHVTRQIAAAREASGDAEGAANAAYMAARYEVLVRHLPYLARMGQVSALVRVGRYPEAEVIALALLVEAQAREHVAGDIHPRLYSLATTLLPQGRAEEAIALLERAVDEARSSEEGREPEVYLNTLAEAYFDVARFTDSAEILRALYDNSQGAARSTYGNNLARALDGAGLHGEAETLLRQAAADARADDGSWTANRHGLARVLFNLARNLAAQGRNDEAASLFAESAALTVERRPPGHTDIIAAHTWLVRHTLTETSGNSTSLRAARVLSSNLDHYLTSGGDRVERHQAIQNAGTPQALFNLHVDALWAAAHPGDRP